MGPEAAEQNMYVEFSFSFLRLLKILWALHLPFEGLMLTITEDFCKINIPWGL